MNGKDKISVIIPCYNVQKYIMRCFESIRNQTYGFENLEVIFVDDISTDNTWPILKLLQNEYPENVISVKLNKKGQAGGARNLGMDISNGKYIAFIDADDMVDITYFEKMHNKIVEYNSDEVRCGTFWFSNERELENRYIGKNNRFEDFSDDDVRKNYILSSMSCIVHSRLFKKEVLTKNNIRFIEGVAYEDAHFSAICCFYVNSRYWLDEELYFYYKNNTNSIMSTYNESKNMDHIKVANEILDELKTRGIYDDLMKRFYYEIKAYYFWMIYLNPMVLMMEEFDHQVLKFKNEVMKNCPDILENAYVTNINDVRLLKAIEFLE